MNNNDTGDFTDKSQATMKHSQFDDKEAIPIERSFFEEKPCIAVIFNKLGEFGRFHKKVLFILIVITFATSGVTNALPFIMHDPTFLCKGDNQNLTPCNEEQACNNPQGYEIEYKIYSLVIKHEAYCTGRWKKVVGQNILFILSSILSTLIIFYMDKKGRRPTFLVVGLLTILGTVFLVISQNFWLSILSMTVLYTAGYVMFTNFYVYSTEMFNGKWQSFANSTLFFFSYGFRILYVLINLGMNHYYHNYILMGVLVIAFIPLIYFLIETPYHYYRKGDIVNLKLNLYAINSKNNYADKLKLHENQKLIDKFLKVEEMSNKELQDMSVTEMEIKAKESLFDEELPFKSYVKHITIIVLSIIPNYVGDALISTVPDKLGLDNIYISQIAFITMLIITNLILMYKLHKIPRKRGNIVIVIITIVMCFFLLLFTFLGIQHNKVIAWIELVSTVLSVGLGMTQFLLVSRYINEVFSTKLRAISVGIVLLIGRTSMFLANLIDPLSEMLDVHPFVFVGVLYVLTLPLFMKYQETLNTVTKN